MSFGLRQFLVSSILLSSIFTSAISAQAEKVDEYINSEMKRQNIPGLSLAVVKNGEVIKAKGYGLANLELNVPATADTVYYSGSVAKSFTATAIMILIEEGKIGLDDKISKYLNNTPESWSNITIRQMLNHTAGFKFDNYKLDLRLDYSDEDIVKNDASLPLSFAPGTEWQYSNIGYTLLGFIINKVTGKFYGDFLRERIFAPLRMNSTGIISLDDIIPNRAAGYRLMSGEVKNQKYASPTFCRTADGSMYFTVLDLAKWDVALYDERLLKKDSLELMWKPTKLGNDKTISYGFGWELDEIRGHKSVKHGGNWQGFTTHIVRFADDKLTVIVLTNQSGANPETIAHHVAGLYNAELRPPDRKAIQVSPQILKRYAGQYEYIWESKVTVEIENGEIYLSDEGGSRVQFFPESETRFFDKDSYNVYVTFVKNEKGEVTHLVLHDGLDWKAEKIK